MENNKKEITQQPQKKTFEVRKERFEFIFKVNDNIICQRYFRINNFNKESIYSLELLDTINDIVKLIDDDLKAKSRVYTHYMYNKDFVDEEFVPKIKEGIYGDVKEHENGVYDTFKDIDGIKTYHIENESNFVFSFRVDDKEVISKWWSGDEYPVFVRNSVDITNKKYTYNTTPETSMKYDNILLKRMSEGREDLVPAIIKSICAVTSSMYSEDFYYTLSDTYGDREYLFAPEDRIRNSKGYNVAE